MEQNSNKKQAQARLTAKCLCCGQGFKPGGPFLRICATCKESEEWQSGNCDFVLAGIVVANDNDPPESERQSQRTRTKKRETQDG